MTLGTWIKVNYSSQAKLNNELGLGKNTVTRWFNTDPKRLFLYIPQLSKASDTKLEELIQMIEERCEDVRALRG